MAAVSLELVGKSYPNGYQAVTDFSVDIRDKEFMILVGPSGCGKSTTMRMIAGLEDATSGRIRIGDRVVNDLPPKDRDIAMVFQDYALYPHMTVAENMSLSLRLQKVNRAEIQQRVNETAGILDLTEVLDRKPKELSGGQRQRVALGRAIVRTPSVFMFDEPLSNLDPKLRAYMRVELKKLHHRLATTMIYVTHDQVEAMTLGDRIIVMDEGRIQQLDTPINIYNRPANKFVASFIGAPPMNFFSCQVEVRSGNLELRGSNFALTIPSSHKHYTLLKDDFDGAPNIELGIRAEDMQVRMRTEQKEPPPGFSQAVLEVKEPIAPEVYLHMKTDKESFIVREEGLIAEKISVGDELFIAIDLDKLHFFSTRDGKALGV